MRPDPTCGTVTKPAAGDRPEVFPPRLQGPVRGRPPAPDPAVLLPGRPALPRRLSAGRHDPRGRCPPRLRPARRRTLGRRREAGPPGLRPRLPARVLRDDRRGRLTPRPLRPGPILPGPEPGRPP